MAVFQLPHHFEALRCMAIERLWDGQQGREPMHDLMGDIMEHCRKPALTLDCPTEEILIDKCPIHEFVFIDGGIVYKVCRDDDDEGGGKCLQLRTVDIDADTPTKQSTLCTDASKEYNWECYYDEDTRQLYVLYNNGRRLLKHVMMSGMTERPVSIPHLAAPRHQLAGMIVVGDSLYVAMHLLDEEHSIPERVEVFFVQLTRCQEVRLLYAVDGKDGYIIASFVGFLPVPCQPRAVDFRYQLGGIWHSVRIEVIRPASPMLFSTRKDDETEPVEVSGILVQCTPGLGSLLIEEENRYVIRHPRGLRAVAAIDNGGNEIPWGSPIIFGRWTFTSFRRNGPRHSVLRYHPYLL
ncbi:hypothetical protein FOZ62_002192 [Perkinsus olseni]|uniref:Uncharacterized protein n=1 Tax=Perkinsus olseni TaxID=32597 RepID=A0A7J6QL75_PEROL|nr:hypothetical protein FOZ62_002192 [Perkinsus olseni]